MLRAAVFVMLFCAVLLMGACAFKLGAKELDVEAKKAAVVVPIEKVEVSARRFDPAIRSFDVV